MLLTRGPVPGRYIRPLAARSLLRREAPCPFVVRRRAVLVAVAARLQIPSAPLRRRPTRSGSRSGWTRGTSARSARRPASGASRWRTSRARLLWSMNPEQPLMPASTVKLFTTGFARSVLGGTARRPTRVVGVGSLDPATGEWIGSWALEVNGDPSLERAEGSGPTLYDLALQLAGGGRPEAHRPAAAPELQRPRQRPLSRRLVVAPPGPDLRAAGRPAHAAREHRLGHGAARRKRAASGCGSSRRRRTASAPW